MARIRGLKPDFFKDEDLACLPLEARYLFEGLWCIADRKGRFEDRPRYIKAEIFPYDEYDVEKLLNLLALPNIPERPEKVFIRRYTVNNVKYIDIPNFLEHQRPHHTEKASIIPDISNSLTYGLPSIDGKKPEESVVCNLLSVICKKDKKEKEKASSSRTSLPDEDFIKALKANIAYKGIAIDKELAKMDAWFLTPKGYGRKKTRKFILNWLNKCDFAVSLPPPLNPNACVLCGATKWAHLIDTEKGAMCDKCLNKQKEGGHGAGES